MSLSCRVICCVALIVICFSSCNNNTERDSNSEADIIAEMEHVIINEIFNEAILLENSEIDDDYEWIKANILNNCKYYRNSNSNITIYVCNWGERYVGLPYNKTICLLDMEGDIKLCFNFKDWWCLNADRSLPCFDSEYMEKIKDCNSYQKLANYLNYYFDNLGSKKSAEMEESINFHVGEISAVVDSVFDKMRYFIRVEQESFIVDRAFDEIENHFIHDSISCCLQVIHDNKSYLEELVKRDDELVYFDFEMHMFWIVSINPKPKKDYSGKQYVTMRPFNYECAYWIYL